MLTQCSGVPPSAAIWSICFISGKDAILLQFSLLCSRVRLFSSTVQVFCKDRWKVGERIFFCLSLLSGCKGTICFCPSFLLRRNIFQLEWSFQQKGEKFMFSFQATVSFPAFCTPHVYHHPSTVESGVLKSNFSWENSRQGLVNCH